MKRSIFLIIIISFSIGCFYMFLQKDSDESGKLYQADRLMEAHPDSALIILQNITQPEELKGKEQALYALLYTQARFKNNFTEKDDSLIRFAVNYYNDKDSVKKSWANYYAAQIYQRTQQPEKALQHFQKADIASQQSKDYIFLHLLYFHWGRLLQKYGSYDDSILKLKMALQYAQSQRDTMKQIFSLGELGWTYIWKHDYRQAELYLERGISLAKIKKATSMQSWLMQYLSTTFRVEGKLEKALSMINKCIVMKKDSTSLYQIWLTKGNIFMDMHQYDSARYYYAKDTRYATPYEKANYHHIWSKYEEGRNNFPKALEHHKQYAAYLDTIYETNSKKNIEELQRKYDYSVIKNENNELKIKQQNSFIIKLCFGIVFVGFCCCFYYYYEREKRERIQAVHSKDKLMMQMQIMRNEHEKVSQASKRMQDKILHSSGIYQKIKSIGNMSEKDKAQNVPVLSAEEIEEMIDTLDSCFNNFTKRLQADFPLLSVTDINTCCLLKMEVPSSSMIYMLNINKEALRKRLGRIKRERIKLCDNVNLREFMENY